MTFSGGVPERRVEEKLKALADEMRAAADLDERDNERRVTRYDARRWADALEALIEQKKESGDGDGP